MSWPQRREPHGNGQGMCLEFENYGLECRRMVIGEQKAAKRNMNGLVRELIHDRVLMRSRFGSEQDEGEI